MWCNFWDFGGTFLLQFKIGFGLVGLVVIIWGFLVILPQSYLKSYVTPILQWLCKKKDIVRIFLVMQQNQHFLIRTLLEWNSHLFCHHELSSNKSESQCFPCACHFKFISWKPAHLKCPIGFNHPTLLIQTNRCTGFHHLQPANTGSAG
jgi:hypothetical protein